MSEYERRMTVSSTEDLLVMTSAKIPAGVQLTEILIAPEETQYADYFHIFVCMDSEVIYSGPYIGEGINIKIEDSAYEDDRVLLFSLSASFYPAELASVIYGTFYTVIIRGDFIENWIIADDTKVLSDDFVMKWA
ncbi:hypothetical protein N9M17_00150 [bacterium]|jgi:hypothetical protein|nr:hypothetical protein [bacterium]|tara:strand:+ start:2939 stop:3343 length:405 start_codon:yes stop_codon:yes gene_type:complete